MGSVFICKSYYCIVKTVVAEKNVKTAEVVSQAEERTSCGKWRKTLGNAELYPRL